MIAALLANSDRPCRECGQNVASCDCGEVMCNGWKHIGALTIAHGPEHPALPLGVELEQCPGCFVNCIADALWDQKRHMERRHPDIIAKRLRDAGFRTENRIA